MPKRKPSQKNVSKTSSDKKLADETTTSDKPAASPQTSSSKTNPVPIYYDTYDAEGVERGDICPACQSDNTVTYIYHEGFIEIDCRDCGFSSEAGDIADLTRYGGALLEASPRPPIPLKKIKA